MKPKPKHLGPEYGAQFQDSAVAAVYRKRPPYPLELFDLISDRRNPERHGVDLGPDAGSLREKEASE